MTSYGDVITMQSQYLYTLEYFLSPKLHFGLLLFMIGLLAALKCFIFTDSMGLFVFKKKLFFRAVLTSSTMTFWQIYYFNTQKICITFFSEQFQLLRHFSCVFFLHKFQNDVFFSLFPIIHFLRQFFEKKCVVFSFLNFKKKKISAISTHRTIKYIFIFKKSQKRNNLFFFNYNLLWGYLYK